MPTASRRQGSRGKVAALAAIGAAVLAGCGSAASPSTTPAGLNGSQAGVTGSSVAAEEASAASALAPRPGSYLAGRSTVTELGSTTPANGDTNPYAIWPVTETVGSVTAGDVLVDDFNDSSNDQGTGTTIVDVHAGGQVGVFATLPRHLAGCPGGVGLTTAMVQLRTGWVVVGSLPSADGQIATAGAGCLIVLSPTGALAGTIAGPYLDGPWDETVADDGDTATLFVTNTLVGITPTSSPSTRVERGDVVRVSLAETGTTPPHVTGESVVAGGFAERPDAAAFVKGPTGVALGASGTLYVADDLGNRIVAVPDALTRTASAGTGTTLSSGGQLADPLGLTVAPGGDLLVANATNGKIVEVTPAGAQVGEYYADNDIGQDPPGDGDLFDVAVDAGGGILFVNDGTNTLERLS